MEGNDGVYLSHAYPEDTYFYRYLVSILNIMMKHEELLGRRLCLKGGQAATVTYHRKKLIHSHHPGGYAVCT